MTVKELVEKLNQMDGDLIVLSRGNYFYEVKDAEICKTSPGWKARCVPGDLLEGKDRFVLL